MTASDSRGARYAAAAVVVVAILSLLVASSVPLTGGRAVDSGAGGLAPGTVEVLADGEVPDEVLISRALLGSSSSAVVVRADADPIDRGRAIELAREHRVPVFTVAPEQVDVVGAELDRLDVETVVSVGGDVPSLPQIQTGDAEDLGPGVSAATGRPVVLVSDAPAAAVIAEIAGADVVEVPVADPRATGASVAAVKRADDPAILGVGAQFGDTEQLAERVEQARTVAQLPGGGQLLYPGRLVVALYGSPGAPELGPLGRQDIPASVALAKKTAAPYGGLTSVPVVPGFEIIVTVASADPGYKGAYTNVIDPKRIEPWIDAAEKAGVYVTLDLQPGRMDFLTQAKLYERLLERPHVGLALDPEWRIKNDEVHLKQIGAVSPQEVNRTAAWLAELVRKKKLPQKALVLHQFDANMLGDRSKLDTSFPELAFVLHADGHGVPAVKMSTWNRMVTGLPPNIWMGWKNFYKEDKPMFTPKQTMAVRPVPYFISYQ